MSVCPSAYYFLLPKVLNRLRLNTVVQVFTESGRRANVTVIPVRVLSIPPTLHAVHTELYRLPHLHNVNYGYRSNPHCLLVQAFLNLFRSECWINYRTTVFPSLPMRSICALHLINPARAILSITGGEQGHSFLHRRATSSLTQLPS